MIAQFSDKKDAQAFVDKCHEWLLANCPNYNAVKWAEPTEGKDETFYASLPHEMEKECYPAKSRIIDTVVSCYSKASKTIEKIPKENEKIIDDTIVDPKPIGDGAKKV